MKTFLGEDLPVKRNLLRRALVAVAIALLAGFMKADAESGDTYSAQGDHLIMSYDYGANKELLNNYNTALLELALDHTISSYGPYTLERYKQQLSDLRILTELTKKYGKGKINVHISLTSRDREKNSLVVSIPARLGLLNYRLILTTKSKLPLFEKIYSGEELKVLRAGGLDNWVTSSVLKRNNFGFVEALDRKTIFTMLDRGRFDYMLRGVTEVFVEQDAFGEEYSGFVLEPRLMIYLPLPYYVFVSKSNPRIAKRLTDGLEAAIADGSLRELFSSYYRDIIKKAKLESRRAIYIENPFLSERTSFDRSELWYFHSPEFGSWLREVSQ